MFAYSTGAQVSPSTGSKRVVSKIIRDIFQKAGTVSEYDIVHNQIGATASDLQQQIRQAKLELSKKHIEQGRWEGLMLDSLDGKCPFTPEQVKSRLDSVKEAMAYCTERSREMRDEYRRHFRQPGVYVSPFSATHVRT